MGDVRIRNYFYATDDASFYDATVGLTTEGYDLLHRQVERLVENWVRHREDEGAPLILDIGAGTGAEALRILRVVPNGQLLCIDASSAMLEALHRKVASEFGDPTAAGRCKTVLADAYEPGWVRAMLSQIGLGEVRVDLIVSVYLYHHLTAAQKRPLYEELYEHLKVGGSLIHGDLFSFADSELAEDAQELEDSWLIRSFSNRETLRRLGLSLGDGKRLLAKWLRHYHVENKPIPVTAEGANSDGTETGVLQAAGFRGIEVPFRLFQNAVTQAKK